jgi:hypothetical protein
MLFLFTKGHYYAYFFNFASEIWFKLNDKIVIEVEEQVVLNDAFPGFHAHAHCSTSVAIFPLSINTSRLTGPLALHLEVSLPFPHPELLYLHL